LFNKDEYLIRDLTAKDFHVLTTLPFLVRYKLQKRWGIFQFYAEQDIPFPLTAEQALLRSVGPTQLPFYLDWTMEASSWFLAISFEERPVMMAKQYLDKFAANGLRLLLDEPMPLPQVIRRHRALAALRKRQHQTRRMG